MPPQQQQQTQTSFRQMVWMIGGALLMYVVMESMSMGMSFSELAQTTQRAAKTVAKDFTNTSLDLLVGEIDRLKEKLSASLQEASRLSEKLQENQEAETTKSRNELLAEIDRLELRLNSHESGAAEHDSTLLLQTRIELEQALDELHQLERTNPSAQHVRSNQGDFLKQDRLIDLNLQDTHLNDLSLQFEMDPWAVRSWLDPDLPSSDQRPPAMLLLTNFGWNQPNQSVALSSYSRGLRETRLYRGLVNHPWFHPTKWQELNKANSTEQIDPNVRYYVFPDWSVCPDANFPTYGGFAQNLDASFNRTHDKTIGSVDPFDIVQEARLFRESKTALFVMLNCHADGPGKLAFDKRAKLQVPALAYASLSTNIRTMKDPVDQGLPPPAVNAVELTDKEVEDIESCHAELRTNRPLLLTYIGNFKSKGPQAFEARAQLAQFHDNNKTFILRNNKEEFAASAIGNWTLEKVLRKSLFAAAPRGDSKFSYRFTEALSAGAIPIVYSDDWLWPFRPELIDWSDCAIILPENGAKDTLRVIRELTLEDGCRLRQQCYKIYKKYLQDDKGVMAGLIEGLELVAQGKRARPSGVHCDPEKDDPETTCNFQRRRIRARR